MTEERRKKDDALEMAFEGISNRLLDSIDGAVVRLGRDRKQDAGLVRNAVVAWFGEDVYDAYEEWLSD